VALPSWLLHYPGTSSSYFGARVIRAPPPLLNDFRYVGALDLANLPHLLLTLQNS
jgi:hypothetical protein